MLLAACLNIPQPAARPPDQPPAVPAPDPGLVMVGRVVTMNDANDVLPRARVWIRAGRIEALAREGEALPAAAAAARVVDTGGAIYPGLIDIHNHPEYSLYPVLPVKRRYRDRYEWRFYDDEYARRISAPNLVLGSRDFYDLGADVGRYGEIMALVAGTTSLQGGGSGMPSAGSVETGGRHFRPHAQPGCLARNVETERDVPAARSWVDIGRDAPEWQRLREDALRGALIVHLAEGTSPRMSAEFQYVKNSGLLGANLVAVHGVGLTRAQFAEMRVAGAKLVWSPLSNFLLYGETANLAAALDEGVEVSLAPDWAPSGSKSLLGELKVADLFNRARLGGRLSDADLVRMATRHPARALGWQGALGQIAPGFLADFLVLDDRHPDAHRNLIEAGEARVRATVVRGEALYGDRELLVALRGSAQGLEEFRAFAPRAKALYADCGDGRAATLYTAGGRLAHALRFEPAVTLSRMKPERIRAELARCPGESPAAENVSEVDAARMLRCRFGLPFEPTPLAKLVAQGDEEYWARILANPNLPDFLNELPRAYR